MEDNNKLEQLLGDLNKITDLFKKIENASLDDVDSLKEESILLQEELKKRYDEPDTGKTDSQKA